MTLALGPSDYWKAHHIALIALSLAFAVVMILNDWQDSQAIRKGDVWWWHLGLMLLVGFTIGAIVNGLWLSFVIGLVALYVDARLLKRRIESPPSASPKS